MADATAETAALNDRYHFAIRRLHSLTGIVPVGAFLCVHLSVNASILAGPKAYQFAVDQIHNLNNLGILKAVEVLFIFLPISFHAIVGVVIWLTSKPNVVAYQYCGNLRYTLQRWTGVIAFMFILVHLWHFHWIIPGGGEFDAHDAANSAIAGMQAGWTAPVYAIGVLCAVFHFANGIWSFLIVWGITIGPRSQTISACVCGAIGIIFGILGMASLVAFETADVSPRPATTQSHSAGHAIVVDLPT